VDIALSDEVELIDNGSIGSDGRVLLKGTSLLSFNLNGEAGCRRRFLRQRIEIGAARNPGFQGMG
jgi:hypothetical protein